MLADRLPAHVLWMGWVGLGWGGVKTYVAINCFVTEVLRHFYLRCYKGCASNTKCCCDSATIAKMSSVCGDTSKDVVTSGFTLEPWMPTGLWWSSHCAGKPNPKLWKYIKIQQWRWEMGTCQLLSKTGRQLLMLWKRRDFNSHPFWTQNPVRVNKPSEFSDFLSWSFWTWNMHAAMAKTSFSWNHGPVIRPAGYICIHTHIYIYIYTYVYIYIF